MKGTMDKDYEDKRLRALKAVLLFYQSGNWAENAEEWSRLTGGRPASTVGLCDTVREAIGDGFDNEGN